MRVSDRACTRTAPTVTSAPGLRAFALWMARVASRSAARCSIIIVRSRLRWVTCRIPTPRLRNRRRSERSEIDRGTAACASGGRVTKVPRDEGLRLAFAAACAAFTLAAATRDGDGRPLRRPGPRLCRRRRGHRRHRGPVRCRPAVRWARWSLRRRLLAAALRLCRAGARRDPGLSLQAQVWREPTHLQGRDRRRHPVHRRHGAEPHAHARRPELHPGLCVHPISSIRTRRFRSHPAAR